MSWANCCKTKRPEDEAYSLPGISNIRMRPEYGEGREKPFERLRKKIGKSLNCKQSFRSLLAMLRQPSPAPIEQSEAPTSSPSTVSFRRDVDFVDRGTFYDRGTLLEQIKQRCATPAARVALVGIGGPG